MKSMFSGLGKLSGSKPLSLPNGLHANVGYLDGVVVKPDHPRAIRVGVVVGEPKKPLGVFEFKTGLQLLSNKRIEQVRAHLPKGFQDIPIEIIDGRPQDKGR